VNQTRRGRRSLMAGSCSCVNGRSDGSEWAPSRIMDYETATILNELRTRMYSDEGAMLGRLAWRSGASLSKNTETG